MLAMGSSGGKTSRGKRSGHSDATKEIAAMQRSVFASLAARLLKALHAFRSARYVLQQLPMRS